MCSLSSNTFTAVFHCLLRIATFAEWRIAQNSAFYQTFVVWCDFPLEAQNTQLAKMNGMSLMLLNQETRGIYIYRRPVTTKISFKLISSSILTANAT